MKKMRTLAVGLPLLVMLVGCATPPTLDGTFSENAGDAANSDVLTRVQDGGGGADSDTKLDVAAGTDVGGAGDGAGPDGYCGSQPDGAPCDDQDPCTVGDRCVAGSCEAGKFSACECKKTEDCAAYEDGDKCNGTLICNTALLPWRCVVNPATVVPCPPSTDPCTHKLCNKDEGKCVDEHGKDGLFCTDGDKCTVNDGCVEGACVGEQVCTCKTSADCAVSEDGNACNGTLFCDSKTSKCAVNPASVVVCDATKDTPCVHNQCAASSGLCQMTARPPTTPCDDADKCTSGDHCVGGACVAGTNTCVCKNDGDCAGKDDGDKCNGVLFCDLSKGTCEHNPASVVSCPSVDDTACAANVCLPKEGTCAMVPVGDGKGCDDQDACTKGETCNNGACGKPTAVTCECETNADCVGKDDGDLCNGVFFCNKTLEVPACEFNDASKIFCSPKDNTDCLAAKCDPKTASCNLLPQPGQACDDDKPCTVATKCDAEGGCAGGAVDTCTDNDLCTVDSCDPKKGCINKPKACDDGNDCTADGCVGATGQCKTGQKKDGTTCNADGDGCTVNDGCKAGACVAGNKLACSNSTGPCEAASCKSNGAHDFKCVVVAVTDGTPCPSGDAGCLVGSECAVGKCVAGKKSRFGVFDIGDSKLDSELVGIAPAGDGMYHVVGTETLAASPTILVAKTDALGKKAWTKNLQGVKSNALTRGCGVVATPDGGALIAGVVASLDGFAHVAVFPVDANAKLGAPNFRPFQPGKNEQCFAFDRNDGGSTLVVGARPFGKSNQVWARVYDASNKVSTTVVWDAYDHMVNTGGAGALLADGSFIYSVTRYTTTQGFWFSDFRRVDATGKTMWSARAGPVKKGKAGLSTILVRGGEAWLSGGVEDTASASSVLSRVSLTTGVAFNNELVSGGVAWQVEGIQRVVVGSHAPSSSGGHGQVLAFNN